MTLLVRLGRFLGRDIHHFIASLHGINLEAINHPRGRSPAEDFRSVYAACASATAHANMLLRQHGAQSPEFSPSASWEMV